MRSVTHCPSCQTQFFVTDEQLKKQQGKVRCGQCLHVFDATSQIIEVEEDNSNNTSTASSNITPPENEESHFIPPVSEAAVSEAPIETLPLGDYHPPKSVGKFVDLADKSKLNSHQIKTRQWLWLSATFVLLLVAISQTIYYLRSEIVIYYPNFKPYLVQACTKLGCNIDLPKKIEYIVIDDSYIQEDAEYSGVMRLSSNLINQAGFSQAYPNLELTLTDLQDNAKLRRIFKPEEYSSANTNVIQGLAPGEEIKIKLAMTTHGETVAGYRVFVAY